MPSLPWRSKNFVRGWDKRSSGTVFCLYFATNLRVFGVIWKPHRMRRLAQIKTGAENKRHTNAHQPFTDHSPTEVSIPPLSATAQITSKHAAICALLLLFRWLLEFKLSVCSKPRIFFFTPKLYLNGTSHSICGNSELTQRDSPRREH
jgi:hypothetical protein